MLNIDCIFLTSNLITNIKDNYNLLFINKNYNKVLNEKLNKINNKLINKLIINNEFDKIILQYKNIHTLNLAKTNITHESLKLLSMCHTLNLNNTNITDYSVKL